MVTYEEAFRLWGAARLASVAASRWHNQRSGVRYGSGQSQEGEQIFIDPESVEVRFHFSEGFACCGGSDPDCYCSFAESPSAYIEISGRSNTGDVFRSEIDPEDFDFAEILKEIVTAAGGAVFA